MGSEVSGVVVVGGGVEGSGEGACGSSVCMGSGLDSSPSGVISGVSLVVSLDEHPKLRRAAKK